MCRKLIGTAMGLELPPQRRPLHHHSFHLDTNPARLLPSYVPDSQPCGHCLDSRLSHAATHYTYYTKHITHDTFLET